MQREAEWESRWWSPIINAEHLAMRDRVGIVDLSAFAIFDVAGRGALDYVQRLAVAEMDVPLGRVVYTSLLNEAGGIKADLTIMRLDPDRFRIVTGGASGRTDRKWFVDHLPDDGAAQLTDQTSTWCTLGVWVPQARALVQSVSDDDFSAESFPFATCRWVTLGAVPRSPHASRTSASWAGSSTSPWSRAPVCGRRCGRLDRASGSSPSGLASTPPPAGSKNATAPRQRARARVRPRRMRPGPADGQGARLHRQEGLPRAARRRTGGHPLHADPRRSNVLLGRGAATCSGESRCSRPAASRSSTSKGRRSYVTSAGSGPSVGKHILMTYLPPELARSREAAARRVLRGAVPGDRRGGRQRGALRPREPPDEGRWTSSSASSEYRPPEPGSSSPPTSRRSTSASSVSPSARTRSARPRRRSGSSRSTAAESTVLTLGPEAAVEQLRDAMATRHRPRGAARDRRARVGRGGDRRRDRRCGTGGFGGGLGPYDLILFGNESADSGGYQVGSPRRPRPRPARASRGSRRSRSATIGSRQARASGGWEVFELPLPAAVTVKEGINLPAIPRSRGG